MHSRVIEDDPPAAPDQYRDRVASTTARDVALDTIVGVACAGIALLELANEAGDGLYFAGEPTSNVGIALVTALSLSVRRVWPTAVVVGVFALHAITNLLVPHALPFFGTFMPLLVLAYTGSRWAPARAARVLVLAPLSFVATFWVTTAQARQVGDFAVIGLSLLAAWAAGLTINRLARQQVELNAALAQVAEREEQRHQQVALQERASIAREMHDVVAHGVSVMVVQAGAARMELGEDDVNARQFLLAVERSGRDVLTELRRTVSLLRSSSGPGSRSTPAPTPGVEDIPELVETMRNAGLDIELVLDITGHVDPGRSLAVYRIVQESLTNALRHSAHSAVLVRVESDPDLVVDVRDRSASGDPEPGVPTSGHGLVGMRERVAMYSGQFRAAPEADGFAVHATIPRGSGS